MKRWLYILLGGMGVGLSLASIFLLWQSPFIPPAYQVLVSVCEYAAMPLGLGLGYLGFINGRRAGEYDIAAYIKASRKRDHHVSGTEIGFTCPVCQKTYRASPLLAGKPFTCRDCHQIFDVPRESNFFPPINERRLLPEPG